MKITNYHFAITDLAVFGDVSDLQKGQPGDVNSLSSRSCVVDEQRPRPCLTQALAP